MRSLHLFNPDNDLALASNLDHYTPPKAGLRMRAAGALLPLWYANAGDSVVCYGVNAEWYDRKTAEFGLDVRLHNHQPCSFLPSPWGWSRAARTMFAREGCAPELLPSDSQLDRLRSLSHRRTASLLALEQRRLLPGLSLPDPAVEVSTREEAEALLKRWGQVYVKAPWSGSGRGVVCSRSGSDAAMQQAERFISSQGSAMVEPALDGALDFAMLFRCAGGEAQFIGTSVFVTDANGHYQGNLLAPERERFAKVAELYSIESLLRVREATAQALSSIVAKDYNGILGVDMLISKQGELHAAVEVNLRKTMGYAACAFADRYLLAGSRGQMRVVPLRGVSDIPAEDYKVEDGKLSEGLMWLSPATEHFAIVAEVRKIY